MSRRRYEGDAFPDPRPAPSPVLRLVAPTRATPPSCSTGARGRRSPPTSRRRTLLPAESNPRPEPARDVRDATCFTDCAKADRYGRTVVSASPSAASVERLCRAVPGTPLFPLQSPETSARRKPRLKKRPRPRRASRAVPGVTACDQSADQGVPTRLAPRPAHRSRKREQGALAAQCGLSFPPETVLDTGLGQASRITRQQSEPAEDHSAHPGERGQATTRRNY